MREGAQHMDNHMVRDDEPTKCGLTYRDLALVVLDLLNLFPAFGGDVKHRAVAVRAQAHAAHFVVRVLLSHKTRKKEGWKRREMRRCGDVLTRKTSTVKIIKNQRVVVL